MAKPTLVHLLIAHDRSIFAVAHFQIIRNVFNSSHSRKSKELIAALFSLLQVHYPPVALSLYTVL